MKDLRIKVEKVVILKNNRFWKYQIHVKENLFCNILGFFEIKEYIQETLDKWFGIGSIYSGHYDGNYVFLCGNKSIAG